MKVKVDINAALQGLRNAKSIGAAAEKVVAQKAADYVKSITPIRTGNARAHTYYQSPNTIKADYPYARRLDEGYSPQAPQGMSEPTEKYVEKLVKDELAKQIRNIGQK